MEPPSLFGFATSELSQDAFICWLASWAAPGYRDGHGPLHATANAFLDRLLEVGGVPRPPAYQAVRAVRQFQDIDVLLLVNDDIAVIVEDKIDTGDHSGQLPRYREAVGSEYPDRRVAAVYLKTGDQANYRTVVEAGYGRFLRRDFLDVLDEGKRAGVANDIFTDFHRHLRGIEAAVQSFRTTPPAGWGGFQWRGFFLALQDRLGEGDWNYVANAAGGFMGYWWHHRGDKYLQLEDAKFCFKIDVPDEAQQTARWLTWHHALMTGNGAGGVTIKKTVRRAGRWMTVAALDGDYRQADPGGLLDFDKTVDRLRAVEAFMDAAVARAESGTTAPTVSNRLDDPCDADPHGIAE